MPLVLQHESPTGGLGPSTNQETFHAWNDGSTQHGGSAEMFGPQVCNHNGIDRLLASQIPLQIATRCSSYLLSMGTVTRHGAANSSHECSIY